MATIRPRPGDLYAATRPHVAVPSGEYVGAHVEVCDLCGFAFANEHIHPATATANPGLSGARRERVASVRDDLTAMRATLAEYGDGEYMGPAQVAHLREWVGRLIDRLED